MKIPKFHETFIPILEILNNKKTISYNELRKILLSQYYSDLPKELLSERTKTGETLILNRIAWGKTYLKMANFIEQPERAMIKITEKGQHILKKGTLTLQELKKDHDYLSYKENKEFENDKETDIENASPQDLIDSGFSKIETQIKIDLLEKLKKVDPYYFEKIILILLQKMGYGDLLETPKSGDGGIDGIINQDKLGIEKIYIQAKRYNDHKVRETEIRNFIGAMSGGTSKGVFVTTSEFDESAIRKAKESKHTTIILIDGKKIVDLIYQYNVGLQTTNYYEIKEIDEDFFEGN